MKIIKNNKIPNENTIKKLEKNENLFKLMKEKFPNDVYISIRFIYKIKISKKVLDKI